MPIGATVGEDISPEMVREAIDQGVRYLKQQQRQDGSWLEWGNQPGGLTALCTLALLNAGVEPKDDPIQRALAYLRKQRPMATYSTALQTMVFCKADPKNRPLIRRNVDWLQATQIRKSKLPRRNGSWSYPGGAGDNSNTQFALLALYEAERVGVTVDGQTWRLANKYWNESQNPDGSWGYTPGSPAAGSMTCAGIASLVITADMVRQSDAQAVGERTLCCQRTDTAEISGLDRALSWLGNNFSVSSNPGLDSQTWLFYYLYALERVGRLTGHRFIEKHQDRMTHRAPDRTVKYDWYREGIRALLKLRGTAKEASGWIGTGLVEKDRRIATSFALLFLSKGRRPVVITKLTLEHEPDKRPQEPNKLVGRRPDNDWNLHRNDVANLTRYVESRWERDLALQVVDLDAATVDDLLQSPVLYMCGGKNPLSIFVNLEGLAKTPEELAQKHEEMARRQKEAAEQKKKLPAKQEELAEKVAKKQAEVVGKPEELAGKLRDYLDRGGFLIAEAYATGTDFDQGFRDLMEHVFPEPEYRLRLLPPEHPLWHAEETVNPGHLRPLWGIDFGCRTSVVYCPPDTDAAGRPRPSLSCLWELARTGRDREYHPVVQKQVDAALSIGINMLAYATNRELKFKYEIPRQVVKQPSDDPFPWGRVYVASLRHPGGCHAAPRALVNLLETAAEQLKIRVGTERREINLTDDALFDFHLVFMHGRNAFHLTDAERKQLRTYIRRGGMLFANSICANAAFAESFRREMGLIFPKNPLEPVPGIDPLLTSTYGGFDLSTVTRRDPQRGNRNEPLEDLLRKVAPELEGIRFDDRWGVIFSRYDLSCALEKRNSLECQGYIREDAARIGLNVLLYSLQQ